MNDEKLIFELVESRVNGNISYFKEEVRKLSKIRLVVLAWFCASEGYNFYTEITSALEGE